MKKLLLLSAAIAIASSLSAQFYAGIGAGYGLGASKTVVGVQVSDDGNTQTNVYGSYGQGVNIVGKAGYMFNDFLGAELVADYFIGAAQTNYQYKNDLIESKSNALLLAPQLVVKTEMGIYSRFGIAVPVMGGTTTTGSYEKYMGGADDLVFEKESHGTFSIGYTGTIGYNYAISDNMDFFAELQYVGMSVKGGDSKYTKKTLGSKDLLDGAKTSEIETEYVDSIDGSATQDPDSPAKEIAETSPFSSIGVNVGIVMKF